MKKVLVIDLGGTSSKCAVVDSKQKILWQFNIVTKINQIIPHLKTQIDVFFKTNNIQWTDIIAIGLATPGFYDYQTGIIKLAANLKFRDYEIKKAMLTTFNKPVIIINDGNAAAYGEYQAEKNKPKSLILYSLGTGVGGGIVINGQLLLGAHGFSGEFGHGGNFQNQFHCSCGLNQCLEPIAAASAVNKHIKKFASQFPSSEINKMNQGKETLSTRSLQQLINNNKLKEVKLILQPSITALTNHISTLIYALNPELVILAGGLTLLGQKWLDLVQADLLTKISTLYRDTKIAISKLQDKAGLYGIIAYTFSQISEMELL